MSKDASKQGKWQRRNREEWQALLNRYDAKHDSVSAFCAREAISETSFYRWRGQQLSDATHAPVQPTQPSAFLDLGPLRSSQPNNRLELKLDLGGGLVLHLVRG